MAYILENLSYMGVEMTKISVMEVAREGYPDQETVLAIDGTPVLRSYAYETGNSIAAGVWDDDASKKLLEMTFDELTENLTELSLNACQPWGDLFHAVGVTSANPDKQTIPKIIALLNPLLSKWSKPWSFNQYYSVFKDSVPKFRQENLNFVDPNHRFVTSDSGGVELTNFPKDVPLRKILDELWAFLAEVHEVTERELTASLNKGSLVTFFDFPPAVKVACEQYLQYFIQFLDDLGIEADSQISSEAGKVLFSVTPHSGEEALEAIQAALATYLELPQKPDLGGFDMAADIAANQLRSQVLHLQGQLIVAQGMLQLGQATIQAKDQTITAQEMQLAMFQSGQLVQAGTQDLRRIGHAQGDQQSKAEPLFGEMVKVSTFKKLGVEIDLAGLLRSLKRKLPRKNR